MKTKNLNKHFRWLQFNLDYKAKFYLKKVRIIKYFKLYIAGILLLLNLT